MIFINRKILNFLKGNYSQLLYYCVLILFKIKINLALCFRFEYFAHVMQFIGYELHLFILLTFLVGEFLGKFIYREDLWTDKCIITQLLDSERLIAACATNYSGSRLIIGTISQPVCGCECPHPCGNLYFRDFVVTCASRVSS